MKGLFLLRWVCITIVIGSSLLVLQERSYLYQAQIFKPLNEFVPPKHWGRKSFVPDWRAGDSADLAASQHFLAHWASTLNEVPEINADDHNSPVDVSMTHVPHWSSISPFVDQDDIRQRQISTNKFAALGESEPFAFAIKNSGAAVTLSISLENWQKDGRDVSDLPASLRLMLPYRARAKAGKRESQLTVKPMLLLADPNNTWTFPRAYTMVVVADVHVNPDSQPGRYSASLIARSNEQVVAKHIIKLEVLPFGLRVNNFHAGAFGTTYDIWEGGFRGYYPEMIEMDSRYGFNIAGGFFNKGNELPFYRDPNGRLLIDRANARFRKFDRTMHTLRAYGMGDVLFWNWGGSGKYRQFQNVLKAGGITAGFETTTGKKEFAAMLRAIKDVEKARGWPEIVINPYDEALKDQQATKEIIASIPYIQQLSPDTRLYMTEWRSGYTRHYQSTGEQLTGVQRPRKAEYRQLVRSGDGPRANFAVIGSNILDLKARAIQDKLGGEYWNYTGAWSASATTQFGLGFRAWAARSETVLIWANYKGDFNNQGWTVHHPMPLDANGRKNRNTRGPVLAGVQAYAVREGIDDRKYIETLRFHAWRTGSTEDWRYLNMLSKHAMLMLKNRKHIGGLDNVPGQIMDNADLATLRADLKERILKLIRLPSIH